MAVRQEREEERKELLDSLSSQLAEMTGERDRLAAANAELRGQLDAAKRAAGILLFEVSILQKQLLGD